MFFQNPHLELASRQLRVLWPFFIVVCTIVPGSVGCTHKPKTRLTEMEVAKPVRTDVPVYSEWIGTTVGYIDAQIHSKVAGYLLAQGPDLRAECDGVPYFIEVRTVGFSKDEDRRDSVSKEIFAKLNTVPSSYHVALTVADEYAPASAKLRGAIKAVLDSLDALKERDAEGQRSTTRAGMRQCWCCQV
jgi:hypothetical protein